MALVAAVGIGVGAMAAIAVTLVLLLGVVVGFAFSSSFEGSEREHLQPIPIDLAACPYVGSMHEAANQFQIAYPALVTGLDADRQSLTWPQTQARLDQAAAVLEGSISLSLEHFPAQVQGHLTAARDALAEGRAQLPLATDGVSFINRTSGLLHEGQLAFGYAGDLIGGQCSVPLGADTETMLYPFLTSTVPASATPTQ